MAALRQHGGAARRTCVRDGAASSRCRPRELVPGDVVLLEAGNIVPADLRLIEAAQLRVEEAALTGESVPVEKDAAAAAPRPTLPLGDRRNMAYKGTIVTYGRGARHGRRHRHGHRARQDRRAARPPKRTSRRRCRSGWRVFGAAAGAGRCWRSARSSSSPGLLRGEPPMLMFLTAVSLAVAAIPEALPAVVTISLALGADQHGRAATR